jgi:2-C-methyl-D-erythritol 4-phosphate cytidylyltransferase
MANRQQSIPQSTRTEAIIVAAGRGARLGGKVAKSMRLLGGKPLFAHPVDRFLQVAEIQSIILVVASEDIEVARRWIPQHQFSKPISVVPGGKERGDSVQEGLKVVAPDTQWILIHDGARPFVTSELIQRVLSAAYATGAAIPVIPITDTVKEILGSEVVRTVPRSRLAGVQTPQAFARNRLLEAYQRAREDGFAATDDAEIVQHFTPGPIIVVQGDEDNFKITTHKDWCRAEDYCKRILSEFPPSRE